MVQTQVNTKPKPKIAIMPVLTLLAVFYFGFLLYQAVYVNYQTNKKISELNKSLAESTKGQKNLQDLIAYYKTDTFQELEARKKLGLKMPGEKVIKVTVPQTNRTPEPKKTVSQDISKSNSELWIEYLFYQDL
jgi:cell division protein FtsB